MHSLVLIPDGVGVRNFVIGKFLPTLCERGAVTVCHDIPEELVSGFRARAGDGVRWERFVPYRESIAPFALRYALSFAHMYWGNTLGMRATLSLPEKGNWKGRSLRKISRLAGRLFASPRGIDRLDRWHCRAVRRLPEMAHYRRLLRELKPSVLFCSHQRPPVVLPAVLAARELGIPTATFIFSWDNITSKGRIAAPFDHFLVWSPLMREELLQFYPHIAPESVHIVGTPQFDPYADDTLRWSREEFFRRVGADPVRPLICHSGSDHLTSPEEPEHLSILMEQIQSGAIREKPQVLFRPTPVEDGRRYTAVRRRFPKMIFCQPAWTHSKNGDWSKVIPTPEDIQFLSNLTQHADLNVNMSSTMTLDFSIRDKPVVNLAFDVGSPPPLGVSLWNFHYQFEHYQKVVALGAARFARKPEDLATHINAYLDNPALDRDGRKRFVDLEVGAPIGTACSRVVAALEVIANGNSDHKRSKSGACLCSSVA